MVFLIVFTDGIIEILGRNGDAGVINIEIGVNIDIDPDKGQHANALGELEQEIPCAVA